jgi:hypothetical protein
MNAGYRGMNPAKGGMETMTRDELAAMLIAFKAGNESAWNLA